MTNEELLIINSWRGLFALCWEREAPPVEQVDVPYGRWFQIEGVSPLMRIMDFERMCANLHKRLTAERTAA